jgi:hypothetical protein
MFATLANPPHRPKTIEGMIFIGDQSHESKSKQQKLQTEITG